MTDEILKPTPNEESSSPSPAAGEFLPTGGSCLEGQGTSTTLLIEMPKIPDYVWSWIRESEAEMTRECSADGTILQRTSMENGPAAMKEERRLTCPKGCPEDSTDGCSGDWPTTRGLGGF